MPSPTDWPCCSFGWARTTSPLSPSREPGGRASPTWYDSPARRWLVGTLERPSRDSPVARSNSTWGGRMLMYEFLLYWYDGHRLREGAGDDPEAAAGFARTRQGAGHPIRR